MLKQEFSTYCRTRTQFFFFQFFNHPTAMAVPTAHSLLADAGGLLAYLQRSASTAGDFLVRRFSSVSLPISLLSPSSSSSHRSLHRRCRHSLCDRSFARAMKLYGVQAHQDRDSNRVSGIVVSSPDLVGLEYTDLNLSYKLPEDFDRVRTRQHVNPLSSAYLVPAQVPEWNKVFKNPTLPLVVDIGCGSGRFILWLAKRNSITRNYLGLEIRKKLVDRANHWVKELALHNIYFMFANATVSFQRLLSSYPGPLMMVFILCPDPHFKKRHHKRRVLQKHLADLIVNNLTSGGQVMVQSDVLEVALDMRNQFDGLPNMQHIDVIDPCLQCDEDGWLLSNPMGIRTEREIHAELEGAKIYRRMYEKINLHLSSLPLKGNVYAPGSPS